MRSAPWMVLAMASVVPPVIACTRESSGTAVATATTTTTATSTTTSSTTATTTVTVTTTAKSPTLAASLRDAELGASPTTATASTISEPPPPDPKNKGKCAPLAERVRQYVEANRSCASAADCVEVHTTCGAVGACGTYVSRGKEAGLRKVSDELEAINCFALGVFPCATCGAPPPPACVGGKCTP